LVKERTSSSFHNQFQNRVECGAAGEKGSFAVPVASAAPGLRKDARTSSKDELGAETRPDCAPQFIPGRVKEPIGPLGKKGDQRLNEHKPRRAQIVAGGAEKDKTSAIDLRPC